MSVNTSLHNRRVYVGLSGGVDSATTAALLKQAGAEVTGVFIKGWYPPGMPCTWAADRRDAMRAAAHLKIPFVTLDASKEYKEGVIDYLLREYAAGNTPNPDIMCNREVKFGAFASYAREQGADFIATGHYAQSKDGKMYRGSDAAKDQSYFLWAIPQEALSYTLFPLGEYEKKDVRALAHDFKLPLADKRDSQGICFLGSVSVDDFLRSEFHPEKGVAIDETGQELDTHDGAILYTLGQRISLPNASEGPWYVVKKDIRANILTVSHVRSAPTAASITLTEMNWFSGRPPVGKISAQYRYHGPVIAGTYDADTNAFTPDTPFQETLASGQSLVLYLREQCLGGGIIK